MFWKAKTALLILTGLAACTEDWPAPEPSGSAWQILDPLGQDCGHARIDRLSQGVGFHEELRLELPGTGEVMTQQADLLLGSRGVDAWRARRSSAAETETNELILGADGLYWTRQKGLEISRSFFGESTPVLVEGPMSGSTQSLGASLSGLAALAAMDLPQSFAEGKAFNGRHGRIQPFRIEEREESVVLLDGIPTLARRRFFWTPSEGHSLWVAEGRLLQADGLSGRTLVRIDGFEAPSEIESPLPGGIVEEPVEIEGPLLRLSGTLSRLEGPGQDPVPYLLLVGGSGPVNRDGLIRGLGAGILKPIAQRMAREGVSSLRFDKRGVEESRWKGDKGTSTLDDLVGDALSWVEMLSSRPDFGGLFVLGHSEGGYIAVRLAQERPELVRGIVMLATPVRRLDDVMRDQLWAIYQNNGVPRGEIEAAARAQRSMFRRLELAPERQRVLDSKTGAPIDASEAWMRSHLANDNLALLSALEQPLLAIYGAEDLQVLADQEVPALVKALGGARQGDHVEVLPGLDHLLMEVHGPGGIGRYGDPDRRLDLKVEDLVAQWILERRLR